MNPLNDFKKLRDAHLFPPERKQALRKNLLAHMTIHPVALRPGGIWLWLHNKLFSRPLAVVLASLVLIITAGTGTAIAANAALPGQALYAVKTHFNEPVRAALTVRANERAIYETDLAAKRMEEAQALAAEGPLDEAIQTELNKDLADHVQEVQARMQNSRIEHFVEVQALLDQAKAKMKTHEYGQAAELGRQASAVARGQGQYKSSNPQVKGESINSTRSASPPGFRSSGSQKDK
jgi:hypothetical protein